MIGDVSAAEGNSGTTVFTFTVSLSNPSASTVTVTARTVNGTAVAPGDYTAAGPTVLTFTPGQVSQTFAVNVSGDVLAEGNETFFVNLTAPVLASRVAGSMRPGTGAGAER